MKRLNASILITVFAAMCFAPMAAIAAPATAAKARVPGDGFLLPFAGFGQKPDGSWEGLQLDSSGNLLTSGSSSGSGSTTATTYPSVAPSNAPGTTGVPFYETPDGVLYTWLAKPLPTGTNTIGNVNIVGTVPISAASLPLPTGAALDATLTSGNLQGQVVQGGHVATVDNTAPIGSEYGLTVRTIPRKHGLVLTTSTLAGNAVYTQPWIDSNATGVVYVTVQVYADQASASNGFVVQGSNDTTVSQFTKTIYQSTVSAGTATSITLTIPYEYYRIVYTNGATGQGAFEISTTSSQVPPVNITATNSYQMDGSAVTQPVSAASLPLPTGAATSANQTVIQSAPGTPQTTAVTVQGNASGIPLLVSPMAVTLTDRSLTSLGTSATQVAASNASRKSIELINNNAASGGVIIWISFTTTTPTASGSGCIPLYAGGGSYTFPSGVVYTSAVYAISGSGTSNLYAVEGQ